MEGLVKVAFIRTIKELQQLGNELTDRMGNEATLTPQQVEELIQNLKTNYDVKTNYQMLPKSRTLESMFLPKETLEQNRALFPRDFNTEHGHIQVGPHKEVLLHETGHSLDPKVMDAVKGKNFLASTAPKATFYTGIAAPGVGVAAADKEHENAAALAGVATGAAAGGGLAYYGGKKVEGAEDRANDFVKRYLTDELGDVAKAEEAFNKSSLPLARKTYSLNTKIQTGAGAVGGGVAGLMGLGLAQAFRERDPKQR